LHFYENHLKGSDTEGKIVLIP